MSLATTSKKNENIFSRINVCNAMKRRDNVNVNVYSSVLMTCTVRLFDLLLSTLFPFVRSRFDDGKCARERERKSCVCMCERARGKLQLMSISFRF